VKFPPCAVLNFQDKRRRKKAIKSELGDGENVAYNSDMDLSTILIGP
jgi:hypothetical protein